MHNAPLVVLAIAGTLITPTVASAQTEVAPKSSDSSAQSKTPPAASTANAKAPAKANAEAPVAPVPAAPVPAAPISTGVEAAPSAKATSTQAAVAADGATDDANTDAAAPTEAADGDLPPLAELPNPPDDAEALSAQAASGPRAQTAATGAQATSSPSRVPGGIFAEDWWTHARPVFEFHGYLRTRAEFFHNFSLGRVESPAQAIWARPSTSRYTPIGSTNNNPVGPQLCTSDESDSRSYGGGYYSCDSKIQNGANMRFRFSPELHISDNLRIKSQVDVLDNLVLGSTPEGYRYAVGDSGGLEVTRHGLGLYDSTQAAPSAGSNSLTDSVVVKRAWAEYATPVGEVRFGRMPMNWGLGMLYNGGDGHDDDYQSTVDRIQGTVGIKPLDLYVTGSWDFANEGALRSMGLEGAPLYDAGSLDDVDQYTLSILRKQSPELERLSLARGDVVLNAGAHLMYRRQVLAADAPLAGSDGGNVPGTNADTLPNTYARRDATLFTPDLWFQLKYEKFRFEFEGAARFGHIGSLETVATTPSTTDATDSGAHSYRIAQVGFAAELEQKLVEDRLRLRLNFGWASGDADAYDPSMPGSLLGGSQEVQVNDRTLSTFRFNPAYRVDMILNRYLLQRIQGTYYIRPGVEYDFIRDIEGQRAGGGVQAIWTRASEFVQTPGHDADLGIELNGTLYYQAKDGILNDTPDAMGGFYAAAQYGLLFPLAGMGYQPGQEGPETSVAQMLRVYLGVIY